MYQITDYLTEEGRDPTQEWLASLADRQARARVLVRVQRMAAGNFGDCKPLTDGVWELRIDHGPGYRVYYARTGEKLLLLLRTTPLKVVRSSTFRVSNEEVHQTFIHPLSSKAIANGSLLL